MCKRLGDVPPAGGDTHVYYGHRAAVVLPGKIGSRRRRRRRRRWRRGCLVQCNVCAAHRNETRADTTTAMAVTPFGRIYYDITYSSHTSNLLPPSERW